MEELEKLEKQLRESAERRKEYRINGYYDQVAAESVTFNSIVEKIAELKKVQAENSKPSEELQKLQEQLRQSAQRRNEYKLNGNYDQVAMEDATYNNLVEKIAQTKKSENKNAEPQWHKDLTQEQIDEIKAEGIVPGDQEYDMYLGQFGIKQDYTKTEQGEKPADLSKDPEFKNITEDFNKAGKKLRNPQEVDAQAIVNEEIEKMQKRLAKKSVFKRVGESLKSVWNKLKNKFSKKDVKLLNAGEESKTPVSAKPNVKEEYKVNIQNLQEMRKRTAAEAFAKYNKLKKDGYDFEGKTTSDIQHETGFDYSIAVRLEGQYQKEKLQAQKLTLNQRKPKER